MLDIRKTTGVSLIGVALLGSTAATCSAQSVEASDPHGSVVRCHGSLSCDVVLRRATTRFYSDRLHGNTASTVVAVATAEAACIVLTSRIVTHVACGLTGTYLTSKLITKLRQAGSDGRCLRLHLQVPGAKGDWRPVSATSDNGSDCKA